MYSKTLYATFLTIILLSFAVFTLEPYPTQLMLRYPWGWELTLGTKWMLLLTFLKGSLLTILVGSVYASLFHTFRRNKPLSVEKVQWLKDDYNTRIQQLEDEKKQLIAFNTTLENAMQKMQSAPATLESTVQQQNVDFTENDPR